MSSPKAVLISDIHFTPATLELATASLRQAMDKAVALNVPLIIAGDTLDTKAIVRGEVANRLIEMFNSKNRPEHIYMLVGNHDLLNEKGTEHTLNFLKPYAHIVQSWVWEDSLGMYMLPYMSNTEELQNILNKIPKGSSVIMHQGLLGANMGHYVKDTTSLPPETFDGLRVFSGHYHARQDIICGESGLFTYIGNPYTLNFGEANDPTKGYQILMDDDSLEVMPTNLPEHIIVDLQIGELAEPELWFNYLDVPPKSKWWIKLRGPKSKLVNITKEQASRVFGLGMSFKLDLIPEECDTDQVAIQTSAPDRMFDALIDKMPETEAQKKQLKELWREIVTS